MGRVKFGINIDKLTPREVTDKNGVVWVQYFYKGEYKGCEPKEKKSKKKLSNKTKFTTDKTIKDKKILKETGADKIPVIKSDTPVVSIDNKELPVNSVILINGQQVNNPRNEIEKEIIESLKENNIEEGNVTVKVIDNVLIKKNNKKRKERILEIYHKRFEKYRHGNSGNTKMTKIMKVNGEYIDITENKVVIDKETGEKKIVPKEAKEFKKTIDEIIDENILSGSNLASSKIKLEPTPPLKFRNGRLLPNQDEEMIKEYFKILALNAARVTNYAITHPEEWEKLGSKYRKTHINHEKIRGLADKVLENEIKQEDVKRESTLAYDDSYEKIYLDEYFKNYLLKSLESSSVSPEIIAANKDEWERLFIKNSKELNEYQQQIYQAYEDELNEKYFPNRENFDFKTALKSLGKQRGESLTLRFKYSEVEDKGQMIKVKYKNEDGAEDIKEMSLFDYLKKQIEDGQYEFNYFGNKNNPLNNLAKKNIKGWEEDVKKYQEEIEKQTVNGFDDFGGIREEIKFMKNYDPIFKNMQKKYLKEAQKKAQNILRRNKINFILPDFSNLKLNYSTSFNVRKKTYKSVAPTNKQIIADPVKNEEFKLEVPLIVRVLNINYKVKDLKDYNDAYEKSCKKILDGMDLKIGYKQSLKRARLDYENKDSVLEQYATKIAKRLLVNEFYDCMAAAAYFQILVSNTPIDEPYRYTKKEHRLMRKRLKYTTKEDGVTVVKYPEEILNSNPYSIKTVYKKNQLHKPDDSSVRGDWVLIFKTKKFKAFQTEPAKGSRRTSIHYTFSKELFENIADESSIFSIAKILYEQTKGIKSKSKKRLSKNFETTNLNDFRWKLLEFGGYASGDSGPNIGMTYHKQHGVTNTFSYQAPHGFTRLTEALWNYLISSGEIDKNVSLFLNTERNKLDVSNIKSELVQELLKFDKAIERTNRTKVLNKKNLKLIED